MNEPRVNLRKYVTGLNCWLATLLLASCGSPVDPLGQQRQAGANCTELAATVPGEVAGTNDVCVRGYTPGISGSTSGMSDDFHLTSPVNSPVDNFPCGTAPGPDAYFTFTLDAPYDTLALSTLDSANGNDTAIFLYNGSNQLLHCNDNWFGPGGNLHSYLEMKDLAAGTYYVVVDSASATPVNYTLKIHGKKKCQELSNTPPTDVASGAPQICIGGPAIGLTSTTGKANDHSFTFPFPTDPTTGSSCTAQSGPDVYYRFTIPEEPYYSTPRHVTIDTEGSSFDTAITLYRNTIPTDPLELVACNNDSGGTLQSRIDLANGLAPGDYVLVLDGFSASSFGDARVNITIDGKPCDRWPRTGPLLGATPTQTYYVSASDAQAAYPPQQSCAGWWTDKTKPCPWSLPQPQEGMQNWLSQAIGNDQIAWAAPPQVNVPVSVFCADGNPTYYQVVLYAPSAYANSYPSVHQSMLNKYHKANNGTVTCQADNTINYSATCYPSQQSCLCNTNANACWDPTCVSYLADPSLPWQYFPEWGANIVNILNMWVSNYPPNEIFETRDAYTGPTMFRQGKILQYLGLPQAQINAYSKPFNMQPISATGANQSGLMPDMINWFDTKIAPANPSVDRRFITDYLKSQTPNGVVVNNNTNTVPLALLGGPAKSYWGSRYFNNSSYIGGESNCGVSQPAQSCDANAVGVLNIGAWAPGSGGGEYPTPAFKKTWWMGSYHPDVGNYADCSNAYYWCDPNGDPSYGPNNCAVAQPERLNAFGWGTWANFNISAAETKDLTRNCFSLAMGSQISSSPSADPNGYAVYQSCMSKYYSAFNNVGTTTWSADTQKICELAFLDIFSWANCRPQDAAAYCSQQNAGTNLMDPCTLYSTINNPSCNNSPTNTSCGDGKMKSLCPLFVPRQTGNGPNRNKCCYPHQELVGFNCAQQSGLGPTYQTAANTTLQLTPQCANGDPNLGYFWSELCVRNYLMYSQQENTHTCFEQLCNDGVDDDDDGLIDCADPDCQNYYYMCSSQNPAIVNNCRNSCTSSVSVSACCPDSTGRAQVAAVSGYAYCNNDSLTNASSPHWDATCANKYNQLFPAAAPAAKRAFITNGTWTGGSLGGWQGADRKCQESANSAGLGGAWKAWLSTSDLPANQRFWQHSGAYQMISGTPINLATNWADLTDGKIASGIYLTESGSYPPTTPYVWTGTDAAGNASANNCSNWTSDAGSGSLGYAWANNASWSAASSSYPCSYANHLYCFEQ